MPRWMRLWGTDHAKGAWGCGVAIAAAAFAGPTAAAAATIRVTPADSYDKIENANPGDEVVIASGTYAFRVYLSKQAPTGAPIYIHAEDPANPPVWDFGSTLVESAPGSYGGGDKGRGCWQISGGTNYVIEGIVFTHCRTGSNNSAGIRYYNGATGITVRNCVFRDNDNGMTGGTQDSEASVEYCEFNHNGNLNASSSAPTHNMYIYGGTFTLRYSWVHDPAQGQNFHIRAKAATLEYNWFSRAASYAGDLMTDDDYAGGSTFEQSIVLRGNVILQGTTQNNSGQIFVLYNDTSASGLTLKAHVLYNTFVGDGAHAAFVHLSNADGTPMQAEIDDNVIAGTNTAFLVENAGAGAVTGTHNWMQTGAGAGPLVATVFGTDPGFIDAANENFHLGPASACIGAASSSGLLDLPDAEYWKDETVTRARRARLTVNDIGAFESTTTGDGGTAAGEAGASLGGNDGGDANVVTSDAAGASDGAPIVDATGTPRTDGASQATAGGSDAASTLPDGSAVAAGHAQSSGCGCRAADASPMGYGALLTCALGAMGVVRRSGSSSRRERRRGTRSSLTRA
jgi:hypothetical protein